MSLIEEIPLVLPNGGLGGPTDESLGLLNDWELTPSHAFLGVCTLVHFIECHGWF